MSRRRASIRQRAPVFLGCEGESEQGYGQLLNELLHAARLPFHLEVVNLGRGAGDPITRIQRAGVEIERRRNRRSEFKHKAVLLDSDQIVDAAYRQAAEQLARQLGINIIWQEPCHEALLLRHLDGCSQRRPPTTPSAQTALQAAWPEYAKPMTKLLLARRLGLVEVRRVATVEVALATLLRTIRLLP